MHTNTQEGPLLVFGATGPTGAQIVRQAASRGYRVHAFVRDPDKAAARLGPDAAVQVLTGDAHDAGSVAAAFTTTPAAVVLALGMYQAKAGGDELTRATANIVGPMQAAGVRRVVNISSLGVHESRQQGNFVARLVQRTSLKHTIADKESQEALLRESGLDVTNIRPSRLINDGGSDRWHAWEGPQPDRRLRWSISRADVAGFALQCLEDPDTIGRSFAITGC